MIQPINQITEVLKEPNSDISRVLLYIIVNGSVSYHPFIKLQGFRTRVSELKCKHKLVLEPIKVTSSNKQGKTNTYVQHSLPESERQKAIDLYKKLVK